MKPTRPICHLAGVLLALATAHPTFAAGKVDPDWPCMQRKVPELSLAQVWNGPELPEAAKKWADDPDIARRVDDLAARRLPLADAQQQIKDFAGALPPDQLLPKMTMLEQGLFEHMDAERSHVMEGIARYAHRQIEMAADLRKESSDLDTLEDNKGDPKEIIERTDHLAMGTRIFEERVKSLTYVCEVPTLIEQRLYQLSKTIGDTLAEKKK
ncbi:hypothetical protein [Pseudaminobacter soli (ex Li et al. 2025)]|uniref:Uncharacterized protein n=1 Tax=Pseudaminobacter soli (ex Li et al. 2025) TaxID=1295366 RepID=A0A2P7S6U9_9HYPH|nr:hypothetical protein [Mesorhizobium soli]PSJ58193.1 hypothetical protein C7I85_20225 [Mesorhizobium soli]